MNKALQNNNLCEIKINCVTVCRKIILYHKHEWFGVSIDFSYVLTCTLQQMYHVPSFCVMIFIKFDVFILFAKI